MDITTALQTLRSKSTQLSLKDKMPAASLVAQYDRTGRLSLAQENFAIALAERALNGGNSVRVKSYIGGLDAIMALFGRAKVHLKRPNLVIGNNVDSYRLKLAGQHSRVPGSIDVLGNSGTTNATWYGRILTTGEFEASPRAQTPSDLVPLLQAFAADPAGVAGQYAKAVGRCCFCGLPIGEGDDPRARAVGYGEVCAKHWGLPFPSKATATILNAAVLAGVPAPALAAPAPAAVQPGPSWPAVPVPVSAPALATPAPATHSFTVSLAAIVPAPAPALAPGRPAGVCRPCYARGKRWPQPADDGSCYQCGEKID